MNDPNLIADFLRGDGFAVVGASSNRAKFGNQVLRCYQRNGRTAFPVNPKESEIEGVPAFASLADISEPVHGVSIITPPAVTETIVAQAVELGIEFVWMQPGAESEAAIEICEQNGVKLLACGPCVLVELR